MSFKKKFFFSSFENKHSRGKRRRRRKKRFFFCGPEEIEKEIYLKICEDGRRQRKKSR
jgi:hypothetical protein